jgi:hypothetical protein
MTRVKYLIVFTCRVLFLTTSQGIRYSSISMKEG